MKYIVTIVLMIMLSACNSRSEYRKTIQRFPDGKIKKEYVYADKDKPSNYSIIEYFSTGKIASKKTVENGKYVGVSIRYYGNGSCLRMDSILTPCGLSNEFCDGKVQLFFSNGKCYSKYEIRDGKLNGKSIDYRGDSSGRISEINNYMNGKRDGEYILYYESGRVFQKGMCKNDVLVGTEYRFKENGDSLEISRRYKGNVDLPVKEWLKNGQIFYADFIDSTRTNILIRWTDQTGKEIKRKIDTYVTIPE